MGYYSLGESYADYYGEGISAQAEWEAKKAIMEQAKSPIEKEEMFKFTEGNVSPIKEIKE